MDFLNRIFKQCEKNGSILGKSARIFKIKLDAPDNILFDKRNFVEKRHSASTYQGRVDQAFYQCLPLIPYYYGLAPESVLRRDMLLSMGIALNFIPIADICEGTVYFAAVGDEVKNMKEDLEALSERFRQKFGYNLNVTEANPADVVEIIKTRIKEARNFYITEKGEWLRDFTNKLGDDISRDSWITFIRQRILAKVFSASDTCYPIKPPASTLEWRKEREKHKLDLPLLTDPQGNPLDNLYFKYIYVYRQYAVPEIVEIVPDSTIVDAGAFVGDTAAWFAQATGKSGKIYAFEPSPKNAACGRENMRRNGIDNVEFLTVALSDRSGTISVIENESWASADKIVAADKADVSSDGLPMEPLDAMIGKIGKVDFIKADIEGSEMAMLRGAAETIKKYAPVCAICLYHKKDDFWEIPQYLHKLRPDYKFWFRCEAEPVLFAKVASEECSVEKANA